MRQLSLSPHIYMKNLHPTVKLLKADTNNVHILHNLYAGESKFAHLCL